MSLAHDTVRRLPTEISMASNRIVLCWFLGALAGAPPAFSQALPHMEATDLNGRTLNIPQDLAGSPPLLIFGFEEEQQAEIDRLLPLIETAKAEAPGLRVWELPLIDDPGPVERLIVETGMRAGIPGEATRGRVVTLYVKDRKAFAAALGLGPEQIVYIVALGANGDVAASSPAREIVTQPQMNAFLKAATDARR